MSEALYPMRAVVERTGLTAHLIRAWERRYGAVEPHRTTTNRRMYSDGDIRRFRLLKRAVEGGNAISRIASLSDRQLEELASSVPVDSRARTQSIPHFDAALPEEFRKLALAASMELDAVRLEEVLGQAEMALGRYALIDRVIDPLLHEIGDLWQSGDIRPSQEHLTSAVVRQILGRATSGRDLPETAPVIVLGTPVGHVHELGCLMAANAAVMQGWRTVYLGTNLPAEEIARVAVESGARAVGLSLVYPSGSPQTVAELERLRRLLSPDVLLVLGGRAADGYLPAGSANTVCVGSLEQLQTTLRELR